jgi:hypothetical protein
MVRCGVQCCAVLCCAVLCCAVPVRLRYGMLCLPVLWCAAGLRRLLGRGAFGSSSLPLHEPTAEAQNAA